MRIAAHRALWMALVFSTGVLSVLTLRDVFLASVYDVPPVGAGKCVGIPGPNGTLLPCSGSRSSSASRVSSFSQKSSVRSPARSVPRAAASVSSKAPCRDASWSDDQKRICARRVKEECAQKFPSKKGTAYNQCIYDGITGTGVTPPSLNTTTLPLPQASTKSWDGAYGANGTLTCTNTATGKKVSKDVSEAWTVIHNVVPDISGGRTAISANGDVAFTVQSSGIALTYRLHFTRSGDGISVSGSATGGGSVTGTDGTVTSVQCTFPFSGSAVPSSSSSAAATGSPSARNDPCQGSLRDQKSCIQHARKYCGDQFPARTGAAYNQCVYDEMTTGGSDSQSGGGSTGAGGGSPRIEPPSPSSSASSAAPAPASSSARNCGDYPVYPDCRGRCAGLPSYPTYQFEDCLTKCGNDFSAVQAAYNRCMGW